MDFQEKSIFKKADPGHHSCGAWLKGIYFFHRETQCPVCYEEADMKRRGWMVLLLMILLCFTIAGCGSDDEDDDSGSKRKHKDDTEQESGTDEEEKPTESVTPTASENVPTPDVAEPTAVPTKEPTEKPTPTPEADFTYRIIGADFAKNTKDQDVLIVWYEFKADDDEETDFAGNDEFLVLQDGSLKSEDYSNLDAKYKDALYDTYNDGCAVLPGYTVRAAKVFKASRTGSAIEIGISPYTVGKSEFWDRALFEPNAMPGAPKDSFVYPPMDTAFAEALPIEATYYTNRYGITRRVSIDSVERTEKSGYQLLKVTYTERYEDGGEKKYPMHFSYEYSVYQNGISLPLVYGDENGEKNLSPGEEVTVTLTYLLRTEDPVVVVGYEALSSTMACAKVFRP